MYIYRYMYIHYIHVNTIILLSKFKFAQTFLFNLTEDNIYIYTSSVTGICFEYAVIPLLPLPHGHIYAPRKYSLQTRPLRLSLAGETYRVEIFIYYLILDSELSKAIHHYGFHVWL